VQQVINERTADVCASSPAAELAPSTMSAAAVDGFRI